MGQTVRFETHVVYFGSLISGKSLVNFVGLSTSL